ncbi:hypothetical protein TL5118_00079 [Thalassovita autumnalis]|uniref:Transcriptional activator HlyU n=1 Tax=Thalassovita autumnalis TaxID=2072972 RepID=A0A0P1FPR2_9RHOB|nr:HlyU family transcriptional regulator [Thalassovita autumnalis]CUH62574.1 hypothetical protein TL5118_00079 [Thalassovita autumnalis]CUH70337.1 hypothetical protein TL5120_00110 [Thalassovita autumnalis]
MALFSKLFGGGASKSEPKGAEPEDHAGFLIYVEPIREGGSYRIGARIEKVIDGELKSHMMIRADTVASQEEAAQISLQKAKSFIDQMGDGVFG